MLQQRTQSSFCDVALQRVLSMYPMWQRLLAEGKDIACCSERGPTAISVARGRQSAPVRLDVSFGPSSTVRHFVGMSAIEWCRIRQAASSSRSWAVGGSLRRTT
jgi:hypothetical protein